MTVAELIEKLQSFPGDLPVYVDGYEYGVTDLHAHRVYKADVAEGYHAHASHAGPHEELDQHTTPAEWAKWNWFEDDKVPTITAGIVIARGDRY